MTEETPTMGSFQWRAAPRAPDDALRAELREKAFGQTEGWLLIEEALALHTAVRRHLNPGRPVTAVEIGSWKGRSAIVMALAIPGPAEGVVIAVDPHEGSAEAAVRGMSGSTLPDMMANLSRAGVADRVRVLACRSAEAAGLVADGTVDVLFVDGSHDCEDVADDIARWRPKLRDGASVAFNDWSMPGVWQALRRCVLPLSSPFSSPLAVQNTLFVRYRSHRRPAAAGQAPKLALRRQIRRHGLPATWARPASEWR